ncbi:hypothetical protein ATJ88_2511 [Isoptericola jiangsuensis]|uniref:ScoMcrA-like SRA domain-containing protein n=1 Tax=Isoptericola jiangsuensis TaxID=548579 RepID=A0A2A9EZ29_9MICO|nr:hypothetical protein [Isoptericola jiangsuensis]PFG43801.1 hypothetical protein ATJ88_2511 [Isoptericola jiangsuensis]
MADEWDIATGTITTRSEVSARFGGSIQGGIEPSARTPNIMVYSDPAVGRRHGYNFDGFAADGAFYYTGEGQTGDQRESSRGNQAIIKHAQDGRALRVFDALSTPAGMRGGKRQRYLGEFRLDPRNPFRREDVHSNGQLRTVLVFRLIPLSAEDPESGVVLADVPDTRLLQEFVPAESNEVRAFDVKAREAGVAERREAELMAELEAILGKRGHEVGRLRLHVPKSSTRLLTDTYDATARVLYEAKATGARVAVRQAIGQLLDYRRFAEQPVTCTVVLPAAPATDLVELVHDVGFELVVRGRSGNLVRVAPNGVESDLR